MRWSREHKSKLGFWTNALRSGVRRYARQLADLSPFHDHTPSPADFAEAWARECERAGDDIVVCWLGHCTVLIRLGHLNILTDPVFSRRIGVKIGNRTVGLTRIGDPPLQTKHLPPVDLILISHPHFDHLDKPTLNRLRSPSTLVVTAKASRRLIPSGFADVLEMGWHQTAVLENLKVETIKPKHWGARTAWDRHRGYNSYVLTVGSQKVLFAGDTALTDAYSGLRGIDLAIFGIGSYEPWEHAHATPEQVWRMFTQAHGARLLPVHHSTFELGDEPPGEPMQRLEAAAGNDRKRVLESYIGKILKVSS
ncbi:MAG: MBL fold metallo-hydrolase [Phycisphaeraceae bacterium]|nr:MBL fold metallo-hydrolase [Phycisphaeraceae bacterium]